MEHWNTGTSRNIPEHSGTPPKTRNTSQKMEQPPKIPRTPQKPGKVQNLTEINKNLKRMRSNMKIRAMNRNN